MRRLVALTLVAAGAAGCGASKPATDAATLVPADARAYVTLHPRTDRDVMRAFAQTPDDAKRLRALRLLVPRWVDAALPGAGNEVDVALLPEGAVLLTQPADEKSFAKRLDARALRHTRVSGWVLVAATASPLDEVRRRRSSLAATGAFAAARRVKTPAGPRAYVARTGVPRFSPFALQIDTTGARWLLGTASAEGDSLAQRAYAGGPTQMPTAPSSLAASVPDDALFVLELADLTEAPALPPLLGLDLHGLLAAAGTPLVLEVRAGTPIPEATIVAHPADLRAHARAVGKLLVAQGEGRNAPVQSGALESLDLGPITLYWGVVDGSLVVSNSPDAPPPAGTKVADRLAAAASPARVARLTYVDAEHGLPVFRAFAALANGVLSPSYAENTTPLAWELEAVGRSAGVTAATDYQQAR